MTRYRRTIWALANLAVLLLAIAALGSGAPLAQVAYTLILFGLCSAPLLLIERLNGRYALLGAFMAMYFVFYGVLDLLSLLVGAAAPATDSLSAGEVGILTGAVLVLVSYSVAVRLAESRGSMQAPPDFSRGTLAVVGTALWLIGSLSWVYFQVFVLSDKSNAAGARGLASLGQAKTFFILLAGLLQPLGILLIAYGYARFRAIGWTGLIIAVVAIQVVMGFVADIKSSAMIGGILVILTRTLVDNRLPKGWLLAGALFVIVAFPVFQAYRSEITGERGLSRTQAAMELGKVIEIAVSSRNKVAQKHGEGRSASFFERSSLKGNVERAFEKTGVEAPFQNGRTLLDLPYAFIPRIIWPDKPSVPAGQLFNQQFFKTEDTETYISPSHLGELYWNFGWGGVFFGMIGIGSILGVIGARTNLDRGVSLTRLLVLVVTVKGLCIEFEGSIAVAYVVWLRSLAAIGVLHMLFARTLPRDVPAQAGIAKETDPGVPAVMEPARYPNLMRW